MLNAGDDFLNADGDSSLGSFQDRRTTANKVIRQAFKTKDAKWVGYTAPYGYQISGSKTYYQTTYPFSNKSTLDQLLNIKQKFEADKISWEGQINQERDNVSATTFGLGLANFVSSKGSVSNDEIEIFRRASKARANFEALTQLLNEINNLISIKQEEKVKADAKAEADAKAKADANAKAKEEADAKAKADADRAKMKGLTDQLLTAKTPEDRARIQAEIDALAGNVAKATGGSKLIVYAVAGLAIIGVAYMLLRRK
jgi:LPXTG-motif cell wall-anchored protein